MVVGDLVILCCSQTSGYLDGEVGILVKIEELGPLFNVYWIVMSDGKEVPFWDVEFEVLSGSRGSDNSDV